MVKFTAQNRKKRILILAIIACVVLAIISFVIGYVSKSTTCSDDDGDKSGNTGAQSMTDKERDEMHQSIVDMMETGELKSNMK